MEKINYEKLNDQIIEQVYASAQILNDEQKRKLIQDKFERAQAIYKAQKNSPLWRTDY